LNIVLNIGLPPFSLILFAAVYDAAKMIHDADALYITTGAGMGVDSGLPDFRGDKGFWKAYPPIAQLGISFSEMANPAWFRERPKLAWAFYGHRFNLYRNTKPHFGYQILKKWSEKKKYPYFCFTSNVDGHFQKAGFSEDKIVEAHGSINHWQCEQNCSASIWEAPDKEIIINEKEFEAMQPLPKCENCGGLARPNILMFGDWQWIADRTALQEQKKRRWFQRLFKKKANLVVIELGAGTAVPTVRYESERVAKAAAGMLIRINPREADVASGQIAIVQNALSSLQRIDAVLKKMKI
jgi:NAD-dependent SIR2 family protein deacetylase